MGCFDRLTGESRWTKSFTMPEWTKKDKHEQKNVRHLDPGADATASWSCFRLLTNSWAICLNTDGSVRWQKDLAPTLPSTVSGASPIIVNDLAIIPNEQNGPSSIIALSMKDGQEKWRAESDLRNGQLTVRRSSLNRMARSRSSPQFDGRCCQY